MRSKTSVALLGALVAVSALTVPVAVAAPQAADQPTATAPAGWEKADAGDLARIANEAPAEARRAPSAADEGVSTLAADEVLNVSLQSTRNWQFVATEKNYTAPNTGVLRARSDADGGSWETYALEFDAETETVSLKSKVNGLYVAVEKNYTGNAQNVLRARSTSVGSWEQFDLWINETTGGFAFQSRLNGKFVAMENNYTGSLQYALRARSAEITGSWEEFYIWDLDV
ncbi:hypothetical protein GCM10010145_54590 [Streptomyces ruber]|uniref:Uncharacterized protein n=2 Tax=Streptomyces TaxID=1883 RepID=A0A918BLE5_9ACTN|nr:hypothetical protein [Streptomyces ruber]GGQ77880.1 hypothetical protein GCM10010145_54590 [Streptomyces ruber]